MEILKFPNEFLFLKAVNVTVFGEELEFLLGCMYETMKAHNGIGLAANQVSLPYNMFVMEGPNGRLNIVNPIITAQSLQSANLKEGCLSSPGDFVIIPSRVDWIQIQYQNEKGEKKAMTLKGLQAVCAQHELEHLEGKSFMEDKSLSKNIRRQLAKKWGLK